MKRIILCLLAVLFTLNLYSQHETVEKNIFGVQAGIFGVYAYNELRLAPQIVLRTEPGLDLGISYYSYTKEVGIFIFPEIALEPRLYYNLGNRYRDGKKTENNSANFISFKTRFHPGWLLSNVNGAYGIPDISIMPTWGFRRTKFGFMDYELGIGAGYRIFFDYIPDDIIIGNGSNLVINIHFRIGFML